MTKNLETLTKSKLLRKQMRGSRGMAGAKDRKKKERRDKERELKKKYFDDTQASTDPKVHDEKYKILLVKIYELWSDAVPEDRNYTVFKHLQMDPFQNGIYVLFDYILKSVSILPAKVYQRLIDQCIGKYVNNLIQYGVITEPEGDLTSLYEELVFECLKGADTLGKKTKKLYCGLEDLTGEEIEELNEQDRVAYICWFNIVEKIHAEFNLPSAKEVISPFKHLLETVGRQVLEGNDFSEFHVDEGEKEYYRHLCEGKFKDIEVKIKARFRMFKNIRAKISAYKNKSKNLGAKIIGRIPRKIPRR